MENKYFQNEIFAILHNPVVLMFICFPTFHNMQEWTHTDTFMSVRPSVRPVFKFKCWTDFDQI
jgi:hypothetical protein